MYLSSAEGSPELSTGRVLRDRGSRSVGDIRPSSPLTYSILPQHQTQTSNNVQQHWDIVVTTARLSEVTVPLLRPATITDDYLHHACASYMYSKHPDPGREQGYHTTLTYQGIESRRVRSGLQQAPITQGTADFFKGLYEAQLSVADSNHHHQRVAFPAGQEGIASVH